jgi:TatD DNase family protein
VSPDDCVSPDDQVSPDAAHQTPVHLTDNHCHLQAETAAEQVAEAHDAGVVRLVTVGTDVDASRQMLAIAATHDGVWATAGVHPHDAAGGIDGLADLLDDQGAVAVGECGLDYHYDHSPRPDQRRVFAAQVALAHQRDLPLVIHSREAWDDTFAVLDAEGVPERTVFHCFTGGPEEAEAALERDCLLSFSGIVTFPGATELAEAARRCPLDRCLVETDAPYLAPVPNRGRKNRPAWVVHVAQRVADLQGRSLVEVAATTHANAARFYGLV